MYRINQVDRRRHAAIAGIMPQLDCYSPLPLIPAYEFICALSQYGAG